MTELELNERWCKHLINSFFTRRFMLMKGVCVVFRKVLDVDLTIEDMHTIKHYPQFSEYKMTLFGYLISKYPKIHATLEATDELDFSRRLKIYKLLLSQKVSQRRLSKFNKSEMKEIRSARRESEAERISHILVRDQRAVNNAWNIVK